MSMKSAGTVVIAAALLAGARAFLLAPSPSQSPASKEQSGSSNAPKHSQIQSPSRSTTGQSSPEKASGGTNSKQDHGSTNTQASPSQTGSKPSSSETRSPSAGQNTQSGSSPSGLNAQSGSSPSGRNAQSTQSPSTSSKSTTQSPTGRSTNASAPAGDRVNLSSEQKTQIRSKVIEHGNAPRVSHVNFNISVGVAVPTTVRLARVPQVLLEMHPGWKSYEYFVYEEEVIIVNPRNRHIVEIIVLS
jgi:hypothetical protein